MTDFELAVWAAAYGAAYVAEEARAGDAVTEMDLARTAFEAATYAVENLRRRKIEPVFGEGCGDSSVIEAYVLGQLRGGKAS